MKNKLIGVGFAGPVLSGVEVSECRQISDLRVGLRWNFRFAPKSPEGDFL